jgi:hypothetical protein
VFTVDEREAVLLHTNLAANQVLLLGAQRLSTSLDSFSSWLLAGFGALFGLLIANFASLSDHLHANSLKLGASLFLVAATLGALQKLIAAYVAAGTSAGEAGRAMGKELATALVPLDVQSMYVQVRQGLFWPLSAFNARMTRKANAGDYAAVGRHHAKASQVQLLLVLLQSGFSIASAAYVVRGIAI